MGLIRIRMEPSQRALSPRAERLIADADRRLDTLVAAGLHERLPHFAPSDYALVHGVLAALAERGYERERFLEWGSALGAIAGLAADLGFSAHGIEIDPELVDVSRHLLADHGLRVEIAEGSFVPDGHEVPGGLGDPDSDNLASGASGYDELQRDLDEFRIVFAYPWPGVEPVFFDLFDECAAPGAVLVTNHGLDGIQVRRKKG